MICASATTVTVSCTLSSCRVKSTRRSSPRLTVTPAFCCWRNPGIVTVIEYGPPTLTFRNE